jgi:ATP-binding cassette subfamily B protein
MVTPIWWVHRRISAILGNSMPDENRQLSRNITDKTLKVYWHTMMQDKKAVIFYSILMPLNRLINYVVLPLLFSFIIQSLIQYPTNWSHPIMLIVIALGAAVVSAYFGHIGSKKQFLHEERMSTLLLKKAMGTLMQHSDQFFANKKVGSLAGDLTGFYRSIIVILDQIYLNCTSIVVSYVASLIVIAVIAPLLLIPLVGITLFVILHSIHSMKLRRPLRNERKQRTSRLTGTIADIIGNHQIVRFFGTQRNEVDDVIHERTEIEKIANKEINIILRNSFTRQITLFSTQVIIMLICIILFESHLISIAALIFTVTYLSRLTSSLFDITPIIRTIEQALIDAADMTEILAEDIEIKDKKGAPRLVVSGGGIVFDDVTFSYRDNDNDVIINNFSLKVRPGESIGLAGHSGGGKTTLSKLLLRFADIQSGSIKIDGQDISDVSQDSLHRAIAYVPQEAYLFHRSLRDNIAYGRPEATDEEIIDALKRANALEFIEKLPNGLDTIVGERGVKLSGGQRQRIAIARAILKDSAILILDEATSALDSASEKLIQASLSELMKKRTSLVVAHRLSTIAKLDRIIVIDNGSIVEQGTHRELLAMGGTYATLWSHQSGGFIKD